MPHGRFRFRAQAALDLRVREEEQAQRDLVRTQQDRDAARERLTTAEAVVAHARVEGARAAGRPGSASDLHWYRFWILRLDRDRHACAVALATREAAVIAAESAWSMARQRRESLERFRARASDAHVTAIATAERQLIDEHATRRYATVHARLKGASS